MSDNKEKHLYYVGNIGLDYTAMYVHCQGIANLYSRIGYKTVFLCEGIAGYPREIIRNDYKYIYTHTALGSVPVLKQLEFLLEMETGYKLWRLFKRQVEKLKPDAVILYGVVFEKRLLAYCKKRNIPVIIERVEWQDIKDQSLIIDRMIRMRIIERDIRTTDFKANGIIAISDYLYNHYNGMNRILIRPLFDDKKMTGLSRINDSKSSIIKLVYAGSLGSSKDIILPAIQAVKSINKESGKNLVLLDLVGDINEAFIKKQQNDNWSYYGIKVYGRKSHVETLEIVKSADFSLLLRENRRYAKAGFSTKFAESMLLGVPVICTKVGGSDSVVNDNVNGILLNDNLESTLKKKLLYLLGLSYAEKTYLKENAYKTACELFLPNKYIDDLRRFMVKCLSEDFK